MKRLIVLLGVAGVSLSAVFVRWSTAPSLILALYRMAFSAALMAVPVLAGRRRELKSLTRRDVLLCLASGLFLGIHFAAYFGARCFGYAHHSPLHRLGGGAGEPAPPGIREVFFVGTVCCRPRPRRCPAAATLLAAADGSGCPAGPGPRSCLRFCRRSIP